MINLLQTFLAHFFNLIYFQTVMPLTYKQAIRIAKDFWYTLFLQNWSHQRYQIDQSRRVTIPIHNELKPKTAKSLLELLAIQNWISVDKLIKDYSIKL